MPVVPVVQMGLVGRLGLFARLRRLWLQVKWLLIEVLICVSVDRLNLLLHLGERILQICFVGLAIAHILCTSLRVGQTPRFCLLTAVMLQLTVTTVVSCYNLPFAG
jgi:hypothetical protein